MSKKIDNVFFTDLERFSQLNETDVRISDVIFGSGGYNHVEVKIDGTNLLRMKTPKLTSPFGWGKFNKPNRANIIFNLDDKTEKKVQFRQGLSKLDNLIVQHAFENRSAWGLFSNKTDAEKATLDDIWEKYTPLVKQPKADSNFSPTVSLAFKSFYDKENKSWQIGTYCEDEKNVKFLPSMETIPFKSSTISYVTLDKIWISPHGKFGPQLSMTRAKFYPPLPQLPRDVQDQNEQTSTYLPTNKCLLDDD